MTKPVYAVEVSENKKIGMASATGVSQASCPLSCPLLESKECYAMGGPQGFTTNRLNRSEIIDPDTLAVMEADAIGDLTGRLDLRVHVVGDCTTDNAAATVSGAMIKHQAKHGRAAWTYTHAWRMVKRISWGKANVLASCQTIGEVAEAHSLGYGAALIVSEHPEDGKAYQMGEYSVIPCPEQTRGVQCVDCRLCMNSQRLHDTKRVISFAPHGVKKNKLVARIKEMVK